MHRSQLAGFIIDCLTNDVEVAAKFWGEALGLTVRKPDNPAEAAYRELLTRPGEVHIEVQQVDHASRLHLDIETDDIPAEVQRLESLGARRIGAMRRWVVMEAPTGQRFCVVPVVREGFTEQANRWGQ